ncbi:sigma-70 family RNA polymerase sigma factor [Desulfosporosinus fructosivorans]|uniref:Sigma-70 family RNA polymerase sigma factor n=1 Tax=Desulfosporosinus fructosivorans TaxID=2018669 RepID=A0A4Z0R9D5_9FIRM|nr:sigma-70 family RNA polymerase sigma factor [Desulfosporosinus fructosivorans]TGE39460.1 sigma-70 family RNA polymerase sigma factor [Desulfosporosinus fructosivorans]
MSLYGIDLNIFEILVKQNYKKVYQIVYTYTKDKYISEDAVQQAFMIAYNKIHQLKDKDKFASWVISIAINEAKRMLNDKNNAPMITSITDIHLNQLPDSKEYDIELKEDIGNVLNKLKQKDMEILVFKYYADLTLQQIADLLGNKLSNTKVRLHRAKEAFRKLIDNDINENIGG